MQNRNENDYDTVFIFHLNDDDKKQAANDGLSDLKNTLPISLITQYKKIKQITIINNLKNKEIIYIPEIIGNEIKNNITESSVKIIKKKIKGKTQDILHFLSYLKVDDNNKELLS